MRTVIVAAGVLFEGGKVLLSQRPEGTHLAGSWEFPGGKVDEGEDPKDALVRELREEIGVEVAVKGVLDVTFWRYDDAGKAVLLLFYEVERAPQSPPPKAVTVAAVRWATAEELDAKLFPPADVAVLAVVRARLSEVGGY